MSGLLLVKRLIERIFGKDFPMQKRVPNTEDLPLVIETVSGVATRITAKAFRNGHIISVSGSISRNRRFSIPPKSHLHIVTMDFRGRRVSDEPIRCNLNSLHSSKFGHGQNSVWYRADIHQKTSDIVKVKVVFHNHSHSSCAVEGCKESYPDAY